MVDCFERKVGVVGGFREHERALEDRLCVSGQARGINAGLVVAVGKGGG